MASLLRVLVLRSIPMNILFDSLRYHDQILQNSIPKNILAHIQEEKKDSDEEQTSAEKHCEIKSKIKSKKKKKKKVQKKRSKVMFKPAISRIKTGRRKKHNDGQLRTETFQPSEAVELVQGE